MMVDFIKMETERGGIEMSPIAFFKSENSLRMVNLNRIAKMAKYSDKKLGYDYAVTAWKDAAKEVIGYYQSLLCTDEKLKQYSPKQKRSMRAKNRETQGYIDKLLKFILKLEEKK